MSQLPSPDTQRGQRSVRTTSRTQRRLAAKHGTESRNAGEIRSRQKTSRASILWFAIPVLVLFCAFLLLNVSKSGMERRLIKNEEERQAAHARIVRNHPLEYRELIETAAEENNLKPSFVAAIIMNESSFRADATSSVGARGLMQVMENTAGWIAEKLYETGSYSFDNMYDPVTNIRYGTWYLDFLSKRFGGDPIVVACAYHTGQGAVANWLNNSDYSSDGRTLTLDKLPDGPTKQYAERVIRAYAIYEQLYYAR